MRKVVGAKRLDGFRELLVVDVDGGAENAGVENDAGVNCRGGKCRSRLQGWKMQEQ